MLSTKEFAAHWGVAPKTVRRWIGDDLVEAVQAYRGGPYYIAEDELHRFHPCDARRGSSVPSVRGGKNQDTRVTRGSRIAETQDEPPMFRGARVYSRAIEQRVGGKENG